MRVVKELTTTPLQRIYAGVIEDSCRISLTSNEVPQELVKELATIPWAKCAQCNSSHSAQVPRKVGTGLLDFETHEWTKHVHFAAEENKKDLFTQDCSKSTHPISIITEVKQVVVILTPCLQR